MSSAFYHEIDVIGEITKRKRMPCTHPLSFILFPSPSGNLLRASVTTHTAAQILDRVDQDLSHELAVVHEGARVLLIVLVVVGSLKGSSIKGAVTFTSFIEPVRIGATIVDSFRTLSLSVCLEFSIQGFSQRIKLGLDPFGCVAVAIIVRSAQTDGFHFLASMAASAGFNLRLERMHIVAVLALVQRVGFKVASIFLAIVHVSTLGIRAEERSASREVVYVAEAETAGSNRAVHTDLGLASLVAEQTCVTFIGHELAIGILAAEGDFRARREFDRSNCIKLRPGFLVMAGGAQEAIGDLVGDIGAFLDELGQAGIAVALGARAGTSPSASQ